MHCLFLSWRYEFTDVSSHLGVAVFPRPLWGPGQSSHSWGKRVKLLCDRKTRQAPRQSRHQAGKTERLTRQPNPGDLPCRWWWWCGVVWPFSSASPGSHPFMGKEHEAVARWQEALRWKAKSSPSSEKKEGNSSISSKRPSLALFLIFASSSSIRPIVDPTRSSWDVIHETSVYEKYHRCLYFSRQRTHASPTESIMSMRLLYVRGQHGWNEMWQVRDRIASSNSCKTLFSSLRYLLLLLLKLCPASAFSLYLSPAALFGLLSCGTWGGHLRKLTGRSTPRCGISRRSKSGHLSRKKYSMKVETHWWNERRRSPSGRLRRVPL